MSWKGFTKAVSRLPQRVMAKAGYAEETYDEEFANIEAGFKEMELAAKAIVEDTKAFKTNVKNLITAQKGFAVTFDQITHLTEGSVSPLEALIGDYLQGSVDLNDAVTPGLEDQVQSHVINPLQEFWEVIKGVRHTVDKRNRKQIDYDRHLTALKKGKEKLEQGKEDITKVAKLESAFEESRQEYEALNESLKQQIPLLAQFRIHLMDPVFECLVMYQINLYYAGYSVLNGLNVHLDLSLPVVDTHEQQVVAGRELITALTMINPRMIDPSAEPRLPIGGLPPGSPSTATGDRPPSYEASQSPVDYQNEKAGFAAPAATAAAAAAAAPASTGAATMRAKTLYPFASDQEGDLPFEKDEVIEIVKWSDNTDDWWTGRIGGREGFFPANYVEILR